MNDDTPFPIDEASKGEPALRILMLGVIYALAVLFAVAFSPSMGFVTPHPAGEVGRLASMEPARK